MGPNSAGSGDQGNSARCYGIGTSRTGRRGLCQTAARCGTLLRLIDGQHTLELPVWHKEINVSSRRRGKISWCSILGALRAVECELYGAEPVGEIAAMYKNGELKSDDEVCLIHTGGEQGYKPLSVPLVNIRATLEACGSSVNSLHEAGDHRVCQAALLS